MADDAAQGVPLLKERHLRSFPGQQVGRRHAGGAPAHHGRPDGALPADAQRGGEGGKAFFRNLVHAPAADLHFHPISIRSHQGHMQSLIAISFRVGYPVTGAVRMWAI